MVHCSNSVIMWQWKYLRGSCECISMGRGVPPGPPRVRASMKPRTTALLRAVPNSSSVYLGAGREKTHAALTSPTVNTGSFLKRRRLWGCFDSLDVAVFCPRLNKRRLRKKIAQTMVDFFAQSQHPRETARALGHRKSRHRWKPLWVMWESLPWINFREKMCMKHERYVKHATFPRRKISTSESTSFIVR